MRKYIFLFMLVHLLVSCNVSHSKPEKNDLITNDSLEQELLKIKNQAFCDCFYMATENHQKEFPFDGSSYYQITNLSGEYFFDIRLKNIVKKWNEKEYKSYNSDHKLYLMRCLDFYNSKELEQYIDSIRQIELKK